MPTPLKLLGIAALLAALTVGSLVLVAPGQQAPAQTALPPVDCPAGTDLPSGTIATIAGTGTTGSSGDGGPALEATLSSWERATGLPGGIAIDASGAILFSDVGASAVRRIGTDGIITTVAGPTTGAPIVTPGGLAVGDAGELFIADPGAARVWRLDPSGEIVSIAGTGTPGSDGDGGPADQAQVQAGALLLGPDGELYIDDLYRIRVIEPDGTIRTIAGTGEQGSSPDGVEAITAMLGDSAAPAAIDADGSLFVTDPGNQRIRRVDPDGIITTVVGGGTRHPTLGGNALEVSLTGSPYGVALDGAGGFYFSEWQRDRIWHVDAAGAISTAAGGGTDSNGCGPATEAYVSEPQAIVRDDRGLFIVDGGHNRIRVITP